MSWVRIAGYVKDSFIDWEQKIAPVIFFQGCNLRCPTCHNKHIAYPSQKLDIFPKKVIIEDLRKKQKWYGGVVLSGGEVTIVPGIFDWILEFKRYFDFPIKLDTNGINIKVIKYLVEEKMVDFIAVDIKGPWSLYPQLTGTHLNISEIKVIFEEIFHLAYQNPNLFCFRTTKVPLLTDEDLMKIQLILPAKHSLHIQPYISD